MSLSPAAPDSISENPNVIPQGGRFALGGRVASPDGKLVAVARNMPVTRHDRAYASDFERRHEERFRGLQFDWLDFQRDGLPFPVPNRTDPEVAPPQEVFVAPRGDNGGQQLTHLGLRPSGIEWSADGKLLLFTADSGYRDERKYGSDAIYTVTLDGTVRRVTSDHDNDYGNAHFSPDGRWILCTRQLSSDAVIARHLDNGGATDLVVIPVGGGAERNLTADWDYLPTSATWSPDGKYVYFAGGVGGTTQLFRVPSGAGAGAVGAGGGGRGAWCVVRGA